jgi:MoxR-like ATPase
MADRTSGAFRAGDRGLYTGTGEARDVVIPSAPPWRQFSGRVQVERRIPAPSAAPSTFVATPEMRRAVDAALLLRRPLLVTGPPGSGKSSLIESVARELQLGPVMRWHVTSQSTLSDALYRYDAIGRLHEHNLARGQGAPDISTYLQLGPLGTALLPTARPRALLIDEIDKSDIDLPSDLLNILERGEYEIPELARLDVQIVNIREHASDATFPIRRGAITCHEFPFIVMTSNGERDFPAPFLRRCIRLELSEPTEDLLGRIVERHLGRDAAVIAVDLISDFVAQLREGRPQSTDQLLNAVFTVTQDPGMDAAERQELVNLLTQSLTSNPAW